MADETLSPKWEKLMAIMERLAAAPPPTINVNVYADSARKQRRASESGGVISGKEVGEHDLPTPGGMPRPYVS